MVDDISFKSPPPPPPPPSPPPKSNLQMLYYGLVVVGTAAIVLALYNLIIIKWCTRRDGRGRRLPPSGPMPNLFLIDATAGSQSFESSSTNLLISFKYRKENTGDTTATAQDQDQGNDYECAVCLSGFEEGEEVRQLPRCKHSFHAPCIDMWLYSHFDCPLCRSRIDPTPVVCRRQVVVVGEYF